MTKLIFTGGRQSESNLSYFNKEWNNGVSGVIFEYDTKTEQIVEKLIIKLPKRIDHQKIIVFHLKADQFMKISYL